MRGRSGDFCGVFRRLRPFQRASGSLSIIRIEDMSSSESSNSNSALYAEGEVPMKRRKAREKYEASLKPTE